MIAAVLAGAVAGCAPRPLLERALAARGGAVNGVVLEADADVYAAFPGRWTYARTFLAPERYAWRIDTSSGADLYVYDGEVVRAFVDEREVSRDASPTAPLISHARWTRVVLLHGLDAPGVTVSELPADALPDGVREALRVELPDGSTYLLGFDERTLLVRAEGPLDVWPVAQGTAVALFSDQRRTGAVLLPWAAHYTVGPYRVADETIRAACVDPRGLTPAAFADPALLPACAVGEEPASIDPR